MSDRAPQIYRTRDLYCFVAARFISTVAMQVQSVALGWQIYNMTHSTLALGLVGLSQFLPMFLLTLPAGEIIDRFNQRRVYSVAAGCQACCGAIFMALSILMPRTPWPFYLVLVLFGAARGFSGPSGSSLLAFLVPPERLNNSISLSSSFFSIAVISGPAIGGLLYVLGPIAVYSLCILGFLSAAILVSQLGGRGFTPEPHAASRWERVREGVHFVRSRPVMLGAISLDLFAVLLGGATALLPVYAKDVLHVGPIGLGFLRSAPALGAFSMAFTLTHRPICRNVGAKMFAAVSLFGIATIIFGISRWYGLSIAALFVLGSCDMVSVNIRSSLIQLATPDKMRGRVSSVSMLFISASNELGEFESGITAWMIGAVPAVILGGISTLLVVALWLRLFPPLREIKRFGDVAVAAWP